MSTPAFTAAVEGTRLSDFTMVAEQNMKAMASNHPHLIGRLELPGMLVTASAGDRVQIAVLGDTKNLWRRGEPYAEHRAIAVGSPGIVDGVKISTPWRPACVMAHVRAGNHNHAEGGEESRVLVFQLSAEGIDIPQPVWVIDTGVLAGDRSPEVTCEFHADGFTLTRSGTNASLVDLVNAVVYGPVEGVPDPGFAGVQALRPMITPSMTAQQIAEARNDALTSIRTRSRGPVAPPAPLDGELWDDTATGWAREWTGEAWSDVFPLGGDVEALQHVGPFAPGFEPDFGERVAFGVKSQTAALFEVTYPRAGVDGPGSIGLTSECMALVLDDGEYFALSVVEDPAANVSTSPGLNKKTVKLTLDENVAGWRIDKSSTFANSAAAVAAVAVDNVSYLGVW